MKSATVALCLGLLSLAGCAGPELSSAIQLAQYGSSTFSSRGIESVGAFSFEKTTHAVRTMIQELGLKIIVDRPQDGFLYLETQDLRGESIYIRVRELTKEMCGIRLKVGLFSDEPYATALMGRVLEILKRPAPATAQPVPPPLR